MHSIIYPKLNETIHETVLPNGLRVAIIHKPDYLTSSFFLAVPYGSMDLVQSIDGERFEQPSGIAHFLEHKLFENNNGTDIMEAFSALSANVNAFTSHTETVYTFSTSQNRLTRPLNLLLDFVQNLSITEASVEKEKGIIVQELRMYMNMPEQRLVYETYQSLYLNHPIRLDIGGTESSVESITKADLETCYRLNYHPSNCLLVAVTPADPRKIIRIIRNNQAKKVFAPGVRLKRALSPEPLEVARPDFRFEMDIQAPKLTYAFKLDCMDEDPLVNLKHEWTLRLLLELLFSATNPAYQDWLKAQRIHDYFGYEIEINHEYAFAMFYGESVEPEDFKALVREGLDADLNALSPRLEGLKRRYSALMLRALDDHDDYAVTYIRSFFNGIPFENQLTILEDITFKDILDSRQWLNPKRTATVLMSGRKTSQE